MIRSFLGPLYPVFRVFSILLALLAFARLLHTAVFADHLKSAGELLPIMLQGLRIDLVTLSILFLVPVVCHPTLIALRPSLARFSTRCVVVWTTTVTIAIVGLEIITPFYLREYGVRPERKLFEYLDSPREVLSMLWGMYGIIGVAVVIALAALTPFVYRRVAKSFGQARDWPAPRLLAVLPLIVLALLAAARSSLDHRPVNPGSVAFTDDALVNSLPLNSLYSVGYAAYRIKDEANASEIYGTLPDREIFARVEHEKHQHAAASPAPTAVAGASCRDLVIILEESLGARFVGSLGGEPLTPNLDELALDGWWFENLYATGTRSVRGLEAVVTGFPPTPGRSIVKLPRSQTGFFTLASLLRRHGFESTFYYGGNSHFDNMKGFFLGNGFARVVEQKDFTDPEYTGSWGVSDGDVLRRMHQDLMQSDGKPRFMVTLTTSHHTPFDFPLNGGQEVETPVRSRANAVRYADRALGEFFAVAQQSPYWRQTCFVVVADHDLRAADFASAGDTQQFPVAGFRIPGLILGADIRPRRIDAITSQIDLPPTLLSLLGITTPHPMPGTDLTRVALDYPGRAIMQYNDQQAYLDGESLVVLRPHRPPLTGRFVDGNFTPATGDGYDALAKTALAHALWASRMYQTGRYN